MATLIPSISACVSRQNHGVLPLENPARLFHNLKLMEREGRPAPEIIETHDRVQVTIRRRILKPEAIDYIAKTDQTYQLPQQDALTARELATALEWTISDIHQRIGGELHPKQVKRTLEELTAKGSVRFEGDKRWHRHDEPQINLDVADDDPRKLPIYLSKQTCRFYKKEGNLNEK